LFSVKKQLFSRRQAIHLNPDSLFENTTLNGQQQGAAGIEQCIRLVGAAASSIDQAV
jgi:hypothetical protein